jgi:hypothetical protein
LDEGHRVDASTGVSGYWPWWLGAVVLALITVGYALVVERPLGVSGAWDRAIHWRRERRREREDAQWSDEAALVEALAAATRAEFGSPARAAATPPSRTRQTGADGVLAVETRGSPVTAPAHKGHARGPRGPIPVACQVALLVSVFAGGVAAAVTSGRFALRADMGAGFSDVVTGNQTLMILCLFVGGVLVGFGTRLAGGCSSGHGLSGCSRLQPASIVATSLFFGTAVAVSFLLWRVL